jgi:hypothetical protein
MKPAVASNAKKNDDNLTKENRRPSIVASLMHLKNKISLETLK